VTESASRPDPAESLRAQCDAWSAAAPGWDRYFHVFEAFAGPLGIELARLAHVDAGKRVLDVGCGNGEPSLAIARLVAQSGRVVGIDLAEPMVTIARRRATDARVRNVEFFARDASDLSGLGSFDAAVSRFAIMLTPEPAAVARAVHSVLRPGARFAACVWGEATEVPYCTIAPNVLQRVLHVDAPHPEAPGPVRLGKPGALEDVLRAGGFTDVVESVVRVEPSFASVDEGVRFYLEGSGAVRRALEGRTEAERALVLAELERALAKRREADGRVLLPSTVRIAHGTAA